jgi:transposase
MQTNTKVSRIGMDIHRNFSRVTARNAGREVVWRQRLDHRDRAALRRKFAQWPTDTPVVIEGTFGWSWLADELAAARLRPQLAASRKVAGWRDLHGWPKSDRTDADLLSWLAFEPPASWAIWLPPPDVRQQREWLRYRMALVRQQTGTKNRIHAILHRHGLFCPVAKVFSVAGRRWLQQLVGDPAPPLPTSSQATLRGYLQLLDYLRRQIAQATRTFQQQVRATPAARRLCTLPGIQSILAYTLLAEIGRIERFPTARHLVSYSLLAPRAWETGTPPEPRGRHVGHQGRRTLKWAYIEAAHSAIRRSPKLRAWFTRYTQGDRSRNNRGYIRVARRLCQLSYVLWKKGVAYQEDWPPRPGGRSTRATRPVKGQPADAMVAVVTG